MCATSSVDPFKFVLNDDRVLFFELLLLLTEVVKLTIMAFCVTVLRTVNVSTLAGVLD